MRGGPKRKDEWYWYRSIFPFLVALIEELKKRAFQKEWGYVTHPVGTLFYLTDKPKKDKIPEVEKAFENIQNLTGIDAKEVIYEAVEREVRKIKNSERLEEVKDLDDGTINTIHETHIKDFFDENIKELAINEKVEAMWDEGGEEFNYLPNKTMQVVKKKLMKYIDRFGYYKWSDSEYERSDSEEEPSYVGYLESKEGERSYIEFKEKKDDRVPVRELGEKFVEYTDSRSRQATKEKAVGMFIYEKIQSGDFDKFIIKTTNGDFRLDTQAISKESGINLRAVQRFLEGFRKAYREEF